MFCLSNQATQVSPNSASHLSTVIFGRVSFVSSNNRTSNGNHNHNSSNGRTSNNNNSNKTNTNATTNTNNDEFQAPKLQLCDPDLVKLDWFQSERIGGGLVNVGNTCFLNSVLQCLTYCPPLYNFLVKLNGGHSASCKINQFCMLCEMERHVKRIKNSNGTPIKPVSIVQRLKYINKSFQFGRQEDAHEFLRYIIDHMWKACLMNLDLNNGNNGVNNTIKPSKLDPRVKETTFINHIFGGYHRSQVLCLTCNSRSNTFDFFMDFILDIRNAKSLEEALNRFTQPETLENENAYACNKCRKKVTAKKKFTVFKAPNVATFQLKRFDSDRIFGGKITKFISYPEELDLRPYMSDPSRPSIKYTLSAVLVHVGQSSNSGHYFCFIRNSNNFWYRMDDSNVSLVTQSTVLQQQAYVLFYTKKPTGDLKHPSIGFKISKVNQINNDIRSNNHRISQSPTNGSPMAPKNAMNGHSNHNGIAINGNHNHSNHLNGTSNGTKIHSRANNNHNHNQNNQHSHKHQYSNHNHSTNHSAYYKNQNHNGSNNNLNNSSVNETSHTKVHESDKSLNSNTPNKQINESNHRTSATDNSHSSLTKTVTTHANKNPFSIYSWSGSKSKLNAEKKHPEVTDRDRFNEELDQGKVKKVKSHKRNLMQIRSFNDVDFDHAKTKKFKPYRRHLVSSRGRPGKFRTTG